MVAAITEWTPDRIEKLKAMWADGKSCSQIAKALGGATRSSVIGKVRRLKIQGRPNPITHHSVYHPVKKKPAPPPKPVSKPVVINAGGHPEPLRLDGELITMLTLHSSKMCKWPHGTPGHPGFYFCGHPPKEGKVYCSLHYSLSYVPLNPAATKRNQDQVMEAEHGSGIGRIFG